MNRSAVQQALLGLTWQVLDVHTAEVAEGILVVGGVVANDAVVFARQIIKAAVDRGHSWQVVEDFLHLLDDFLEGRRGAIESFERH
jgi:hypothetical protein